ncbi:MAG: hypothetical protein IT236_01695 [Bacteroidia bacterium]|nr:hypothetical protein [Bacteroidia bacterium]
MSFEEEFDKGIKEKVEQASYPFDPANWEKASGLLDAERRVAGTSLMRKMAIPAVVLGVATIGIIWMMNSGGEANTQLALKPATEPEVANVSASVNQGPAEAIQAPTMPQSATNSQVKSEVIPAPVTEQTNTANKSLQHNALLVRAASQPEIKSQTAGIKKPQTSEETQLTTTESNESSPVLNSSEQNNGTPMVFSSAKNIPVADPLFAMEPQNAPLKINTVESANANTKQSQTAATESGATPEITNSEAELDFEYLTLLNLSSNNEPEELHNGAFVLLPRYDDDYYKQQRKHKTHFANVEAGANYNFGWNTAAGKDGKGLNGYGGVNYGYYLSKKMAIGAGFQVYNLGNTSQKFYEVINKNYDFGYSTSGASISSKNLIYLAIPLKMYYQLNANNQIGLGFNAGYLAFAKSTVQTYQIKEGATTYNPNTITSGVYTCAKPYSFMLTAFYKMQVAKRMAINTEFVYGLSDIFSNTATIKNNESPLGIRLGLQYTLFDK